MSCNNKWSMLAALLVGASLLTGCITEVEPEQDDIELSDEQAADFEDDVAFADADEADEVMQDEDASLSVDRVAALDADMPEVSPDRLFGEFGQDGSEDPMTVLSQHAVNNNAGAGNDDGEDGQDDEMAGPDPQPWHRMDGPDPQPWELTQQEQEQDHTQGPDPQPWHVRE